MKTVKGFTLIELMIVVAIIGILSAIAIPKFADLIRKSNEAATKGNLGAVRSAISIYYGEQEGWFPRPTLSGSVAAGTLEGQLRMENGKYIKEMPNIYCPPYHLKNKIVNVLTTKQDIGTWGYCSATNAAAVQLGDFWVSCTHTDSKNTDWSTY